MLVLETTNKIILCIIIIKTSMCVMQCLLYIQVLYYTNFPCNWYNHMIFEDTFKSVWMTYIYSLCIIAILSETEMNSNAVLLILAVSMTYFVMAECKHQRKDAGPTRLCSPYLGYKRNIFSRESRVLWMGPTRDYAWT